MRTNQGELYGQRRTGPICVVVEPTGRRVINNSIIRVVGSRGAGRRI